MKVWISTSLVIFSLATVCDAASTLRDIVVTEVGLSQNTNRVFVKSSNLASDSVCSDKEHYAIDLGTPESYLFYSVALTSMNEGTKMRVQYELDQCSGNAPRVDVFWNLNQ